MENRKPSEINNYAASQIYTGHSQTNRSFEHTYSLPWLVNMFADPVGRV